MTETPNLLPVLATALFAGAIVHTFLASRFLEMSHRFPKGSTAAGIFHLLGEVEVVFGFWASIYVGAIALAKGSQAAIAFVEGLNFNEPAFVFVIMAVASTRPVRSLAARLIDGVAHAVHRILPWVRTPTAFYAVALVLGPLLGSLITEPAAMTVIALILRERYFEKHVSTRFKYATLALLFVNVSVGGVLTHFAAPPVVMVASTWGWNTPYLFVHFGEAAILAVTLNAALALAFLRKELQAIPDAKAVAERAPPPWGLTVVHLLMLAAVVYTAHHASVFLGLFLLFLGVTQITERHQDPIQLREAMLVGFFLGGLVVLGAPQSWWLSPLLSRLGEFPLFAGTTLLTAITDNAALTYLGSQVAGLSDGLKHALVAGAVTGGGLTVIANAPNPAGYGILKGSFDGEGIRALELFRYALVPTLVAFVCFLTIR